MKKVLMYASFVLLFNDSVKGVEIVNNFSPNDPAWAILIRDEFQLAGNSIHSVVPGTSTVSIEDFLVKLRKEMKVSGTHTARIVAVVVPGILCKDPFSNLKFSVNDSPKEVDRGIKITIQKTPIPDNPKHAKFSCEVERIDR